jgi:hypothetical protein
MSETEGSTATTEGGGEGTRTFTQDEVNAAVRARAEALIKSRYGDLGELKAKASRLDQLEESSKTELDKAVEKARAEGRSEAAAAGNARLVAAEAKALAAAARFRDPGDAAAFLDLSSVKVGDDGSVDVDAVQRLLEELATSKPYLVDGNGQAPPGGFGGGPRTPPPAGRNMNQLIREAAGLG